MNVHVVGYEPKENCLGSGGFNWWISNELAERDFIDLHKTFITSDEYHIYRGVVSVSVDEFETLTDELRDKITDEVEKFLEENDWEKSFL